MIAPPVPSPATAPLVVVEDSDEDYDVLCWALRRVGVDRPVHRCASGAELLALLRGGGGGATHPALVLLDLDLVADDGRALLAEVKGDAALRRIPIVVWTSSQRPEDVALCYDRGASGYAVKPVGLDRLVDELRALTGYWFGCVLLPLPHEPSGRAGGAGPAVAAGGAHGPLGPEGGQ